MSSTNTSHSAAARWVLLGTLALVFLAVVWSTLAGAVSADEDAPAPVSPVASAQEQEDADSDPEANLPFLFAVYIITWAGFFAYAFVMSRRQKEMRRELDALKAAVAEREAGSRPSE